MASAGRIRRKASAAGAAPLSPRRKWRAITVATLLLVPSFWFVLAGVVATSSDRVSREGMPNAAGSLALGLSLVPFVFLVLSFMSEHPRAPGATLRAMGLTLLVGIPVAAIAPDALTGLVAGVGAGGIAALRADDTHSWKDRALAVVAASVYVFLLIRTVPDAAILVAPILPFTGIGVADHLSERKAERAASRT